MKKLFILIMAAALSTAIHAQSVKIMKDGEVVASFSAAQFDKVVFSPETSPAQEIAGTYSSTLNVTLVEAPQYGVVITTNKDFQITANTDGTALFAMPMVTYEAMKMDLPAVNVGEVEIEKSESGKFSFSKDFSFVEEGTEKSVSGTVSGWIEGKNYEVTQTMKYGTMPFTLNMVYTPASDAE